MDLLQNPQTRLLLKASDFKLYSLQGRFDEETRVELRGDNLGIFACLRGTLLCDKSTIVYQCQQHLIWFALRCHGDKIIPKGTDLLVLFTLFPLSTLERVLKKIGASDHMVMDCFTQRECTVAYSNQQMLQAFLRLHRETTDRLSGHEHLAEMAMTEILIYFVRLFCDEGATDESNFVIDQTKAYLSDQLHRKISLDEVAKYAGYSRSHFCKMFKMETGHSVVQYVNILRVERACERLRSGKESVEKIANDVGFANLNHFYKTFKKITGLLPSAYKENSFNRAV